MQHQRLRLAETPGKQHCRIVHGGHECGAREHLVGAATGKRQLRADGTNCGARGRAEGGWQPTRRLYMRAEAGCLSQHDRDRGLRLH